MSVRHAHNSKSFRSLAALLTVVFLMNGFVFVSPQIVSPAQAESQSSYRWRIDDGNEVNASWDADENTIIDDFHRGESRRLRLGLTNSGSDTELLRTAAQKAGLGEDYFWPAVIDQSNGYAYFGTYTQPCQIVKVQLSDFTRVGKLELSTGENECSSAVIDTANGYAYFGMGTQPGKIARVNLSSFTHDSTLTLDSGEDFLEAATIDTANGFAYFGTRTSPGRVIKVNLSTFARDSAITLNAGENGLQSAGMDSSYIYFGTNTSPGRVVRIDTATFLRDSAITLNSGEDYLYNALIDESLGYAYFTTFTFPGAIVRVDLSSFTRTSALTLNSGENSIASAMIDTSGATHYAYLGTGTSPGKMVRVNLSSFVRVDAVTLNSDEPHLFAGVLDSTNGFAYFGTYQNVPGKIVKVRTSDMTRIGALSNGDGGQNRYGAGVVDSNGQFGYFGTDTKPAKIVKVNMATLATVDSLTLPAGEDGIQSAVLDQSEGYAYFGTNTSPGKIIKVRTSDLTRIAVLSLLTGEDQLQGAVIDTTGATHYAYFATYTAPMLVVKINLSTFSRIASLTMSSGEDRNYGAAVIDTSNGYAYFGTYTVPGKVIKVNLSSFSRTSAITLNTGENNLNSAVIDSASGAAYFSTFTSPGRVVKVNLDTFGRNSAYVFAGGENFPSDGVIDTANGFAYWGTFWEFPAKIIKIRLSDMSRAAALTLPTGQDRMWTAVMDQRGGYAYFASYANPSTLYKISVAPKYEFRLEYSLKDNESQACADTTGWARVPSFGGATTEHFEMHPTARVANESATTNVAGGLTDGNSSFRRGYVMTTNAQTPEMSLGESQFTELEYSIETTDESLPYGQYCFRVTDAGALLNNYSVYAEAIDPTDDPTINNKVLLSRNKINEISTFYLEFELQNTFSTGTLTVTFPDKFSILTAPTSGHACLSNFDHDNVAKTITAMKTNCNTGETLYLDGATVQNPDTAGPYVIRWTNDDPGEATVYILDNDQVMVASNVDPQLSFNVGATDTCNQGFSGNGRTVPLGTLDTGTVTTSDKNSIQHICTRLTANSTYGTVVTVKSDNAALASISTPADTIPSSTATLAAGTEGYGLCIGTEAGHTGKTGSGDDPNPVSPWNPGTCNVDSLNVGGLTTSAQPLWTLASTSQDAFARIFVKATISSLTEAHDDYSDILTFIATCTY